MPDHITELLTLCRNEGVLLDADLLSVFSEPEDVLLFKKLLPLFKHTFQTPFLTRATFEQHKPLLEKTLARIDGPQFEKLKIKLGLHLEITHERAEIPSPSFVRAPVSIDFAPLTHAKHIEVGDFVTHFRNRFNTLRTYLQEHPKLQNPVSLGKLDRAKQNVSVIGLVYAKSVTKNKNIIFELEDLTGRAKVMVSQNKPELYQQAEEVTLDSVIGFTCSGSSDILFANEIFFPECSLPERKRAPTESYAVFLGDLHVGSKLFLEAPFLRFIDYLNGGVLNTPEVSKIKYLFINGDIIAGVGSYPGQEKGLAIPDVESQFTYVAEMLSKIRKDITIIITPGNHDMVRLMEPQPIFNERYAWRLLELPNVILSVNPSYVTIGKEPGFEGFSVLLYHGFSYHYYANNIPKLISEKAVHHPDKIMQYLLKQRHLAPTHTSTQYFPLEQDGLLIRKIPDIFASGHTHTSAVSYFNNILIISNSSWESMTPYQEKMGNKPDFCKVPLFNLKTRAIKILDFE